MLVEIVSEGQSQVPRKDYRNITWDSFKMDSGKITPKSNFNWNAFNRIQDFCPVKIIGIRVEEKTRWNLVHCYWAYKKGSSLDYYTPSEEDYEDKINNRGSGKPAEQCPEIFQLFLVVELENQSCDILYDDSEEECDRHRYKDGHNDLQRFIGID